MNVSELKYQVESHGQEPYFFTRDTMKFFGDTMKNYGVYKSIITTNNVESLSVYALYRKKPVKHGLDSITYFNAETFEREFKKI